MEAPVISKIDANLLFYLRYPSTVETWVRQLKTERLLHLVDPGAEVDPSISQVQFAERLLKAYRLAETEMRHNGALPREVWQTILNSNYAPLVRALENANPAGLAQVLNRMFCTSITMGLSMFGELSYFESKPLRKFFLMWWLDDFLSLCAYMGLISENFDGNITAEPMPDVRQLYSALEEKLGIDLNHPLVCGAFGAKFNGKFMLRTSWRNIHSAKILFDFVEKSVTRRIVEVGAGFGGVCYWINKIAQNKIQYTIYDFPILNVISAYFIHAALPEKRIVLIGEPADTVDHEAVVILPHWKVHEEPALSADITFNQDSLPEMPRLEAEAYLKSFDRISKIGFYTVNHETALPWTNDPNSAQLRLIDLEPSFRRLTRAYRCRAWMVPGYLEYFYKAPEDVTN